MNECKDSFCFLQCIIGLWLWRRFSILGRFARSIFTLQAARIAVAVAIGSCQVRWLATKGGEPRRERRRSRAIPWVPRCGRTKSDDSDVPSTEHIDSPHHSTTPHRTRHERDTRGHLPLKSGFRRGESRLQNQTRLISVTAITGGAPLLVSK